MWMQYCGPLVFRHMTSGQNLYSYDKNEYRTGNLWPDREPLSVERWQHWKTRLVEIAADASNLELQKETTDQIADVLRVFEAVEAANTDAAVSEKKKVGQHNKPSAVSFTNLVLGPVGPRLSLANVAILIPGRLAFPTSRETRDEEWVEQPKLSNLHGGLAQW